MMPARRYMVSPQGGGVPTAATATVVHVSTQDPNPSNLDTYWNTITANPANPTTGISQAGYLSQQNIAGNHLLVIALCANDFATGPDPAGNSIFDVNDPVNGGYSLLGHKLNNSNDCNTDMVFSIKWNAQPLLSTSWSGLGAVSSGGVLTLSGSVSGVMRIGQRILSASTPAVSNTGGETVVLSLLSGSMGQPGSTYQLSAGIGATTFAAEAMTTRDFIAAQASVKTNPAVRDYPGMIMMELSGLDGSSSFFGASNYSTVGAGTDNMSTGNVVGPASGGLFVAFHWNGGAVNAPLSPAAGTGWANSQAFGVFNLGSAIGLIEWKHFAVLGTQAATASLGSANNCMSAGVMLLDHP